MTKYDLLKGQRDNDKDRAAQFAEIMNECTLLERQVDKLNDIINQNRELHQYMWKDRTGHYTSVMDLTDDHLKNIIKAFQEGRLELSSDKRNLLMEEIAMRDLTTKEFLLPY